MLLYSSGGKGRALHFAMHPCMFVCKIIQSENFGCQRKMADFSGVFEKVV